MKAKLSALQSKLQLTIGWGEPNKAAVRSPKSSLGSHDTVKSVCIPAW